MDCGSGLILLIRQHLLGVPVGGVLELRSQEPTVCDELPPWCRMTGHAHLLTELLSPGHWRHWLRRGSQDGAAQLAEDQRQADDFRWRVRLRSANATEATLLARNFSWKLGQAASFEARDAHPSAVESFVGALLADVANSFTTRCSRLNLLLDEMEATAVLGLHSVNAHLGLAEGDPSINTIELTLFVSSAAAGAELRATWEETKKRSPLFQTVTKACILQDRFVIA
jgi:TusA-related sulfurtransferase